MKVYYTAPSLPILREKDVIIAGGSLAGIAAALEFVRSGLQVTLVEPRTYLGREITATLRPWIVAGEYPLQGVLAEVVRSASQTEGSWSQSGEIPLHMDEVKLTLEDQLLATGVDLLYASLPVGLAWRNGKLAGIMVGNKSGRQVLRGKLIIDATETALLSRLAGLDFEPDKATVWKRNVEFDNVADLGELALLVPEELGIVGNRVKLHPGYRRGLVIVESEFHLPTELTGLEAMSWREIETRERCMRLASWLVHQAPPFSKAYLGNVAYEPEGLYTSRITGDDPAWTTTVDTARVEIPTSGKPALFFPLARFTTPLPGLWALGPGARLERPELWSDPLPANLLGLALARAILAQGKAILTAESTRKTTQVLGLAPTFLEVKEPYQPQRGRQYVRQEVPISEVPILCEVDVLVVGGGTSGAIAAYAAAKEGARTFIVEMNPGLGGTGTYGGVHSYWCGYRGGFVARVRKWINQSQKELGLQGLKGYIPVWNMDSKAYALEREIKRLGVGFLFNAKVIGAIQEGKVVRGVVAATRLGPVALLGKITIDASGDGDVAAFAGAQFVYGSVRDHSVMWYSLPQFYKPGRNRNNFTSPVDVSNIEDYNRAILSGRRRGKVGKDHDHGIYIATRESRHIVGEVTTTLTDQLLFRAWEDVISLAFSNNDIKGQIYSEWVRFGLISPHLEIEIPYRVLLPKGLENILVVGKAVSTTHDALPAIRMQPDFENLGGAAGLAAALAVKTGTTAREVDIPALQARIGKYRVLPARFLKRRLRPLKYSSQELESLVKSLSTEKPLHAYSDMRLYKVFRERIPFVDITTAGPQAIPFLERELAVEKDRSRRILLAQALALMGSRASVPVLVSEIMENLQGDSLPERDFVVRQADRFSPDQAAMPTAAYLLFSLAEARDERALPVWQRVVDQLAHSSEKDLWSQRKGIFYYVDAVCVGAEKLGHLQAVPILQQLHSYPALQGKRLTHGFQADYLLERPAYLEVVIARALARCGAPEGVVTLIDYLEDVRALLAEQAHSELVSISGQDFGKDGAAWGQWLEGHSESLQPIPWAAPSDAMAAWEETVLVAEE